MNIIKKLIGLTAVTIILTAQAHAAVTHITSEGAAASDAITFPAASSAWRSEGIYPRKESLSLIKTGMTKYELYEQLGKPHFSEGIFGVKEWNYLLKFNTSDGMQLCQYQIKFRDAKLLSSYWDKPECVAWSSVEPQKVVEIVEKIVQLPAPAAVVTQQLVQGKKITLNTDALFAFGKSTRLDIKSSGLQQIRTLASQILQTDAGSIIVVGHTDRIGTDAANFALSQARAQTVRSVLIEAGVAPSSIRALGAGSTQAVKSCTGDNEPETIACLQPNRRVEIEVVGTEKPKMVSTTAAQIAQPIDWQPIVIKGTAQ